MNLGELLRSLTRRWYLLVAGLLATAVLAYGALAAVPPSYEARGYVALMPGEAIYPEGGNPFLYLGGGTTVRDLLVRVMATEDVTEAVSSAHPEASFSVAPDPAGPLLEVMAAAPTPDEALATLDAVMAQLPGELSALHDSRDVPVDARFTLLTLAEDSAASINRSSTNRALVVAVAGGLGATLLITGWLDGVLLSRRGRRRRLAVSREAAAVDRRGDMTGAGVGAERASREGAPTV